MPMATIDDLEDGLDVLFIARRKALMDARSAVVWASTLADAITAIDALVAAASAPERTFGGERFVSWSAGDATADTAKAYRRGGIRARFAGGEMFVHHADVAKARAFARRP